MTKSGEALIAENLEAHIRAKKAEVADLRLRARRAEEELEYLSQQGRRRFLVIRHQEFLVWAHDEEEARQATPPNTFSFRDPERVAVLEAPENKNIWAERAAVNNGWVAPER